MEAQRDIVVGVDGSSGSDHALEWAIAEAARADCGLVLAYGLTPMTPNERGWLARGGADPTGMQRQVRRKAEEMLREKAKKIAEDNPGVRITTTVCEQDPRAALAGLSRHAHQVVVGSRGHGPIASLLLGSVSQALTRTADCPVVVVRPPSAPAVEPGVVVGLSSTQGSGPALSAGFAEAAARGVPLVVALCVWDGFYVMGSWGDPTEDSPGFDELRVALAAAIDGVGRQYPEVSVTVLVEHGSVTHCFLDLSRARDLLVLGRSGTHAAWGAGSGSLTTVVVEHAHVPVMVVP